MIHKKAEKAAVVRRGLGEQLSAQAWNVSYTHTHSCRLRGCASTNGDSLKPTYKHAHTLSHTQVQAMRAHEQGLAQAETDAAQARAREGVYISILGACMLYTFLYLCMYMYMYVYMYMCMYMFMCMHVCM
jgi:sirohydrochlorin ferrochelatase